MATSQTENVWLEIKHLRRRLEQLEDAVLSPDDKRALKTARKEFRAGKTRSHMNVVDELL
ncbi:MAG: hypothetical protein OK439_03525 [Thaumarchaeota archaeon]|nr:hypothetical protein [Nitrososphaerota archaeon]